MMRPPFGAVIGPGEFCHELLTSRTLARQNPLAPGLHRPPAV